MVDDGAKLEPRRKEKMHFSSSHICAAVKGNEIQSLVAVWMGAEDTVFSEGSQAQKDE